MSYTFKSHRSGTVHELQNPYSDRFKCGKQVGSRKDWPETFGEDVTCKSCLKRKEKDLGCRCGRHTATSHPCHAETYTCPEEGTKRFVVTNPTPCLAGNQQKAVGYWTNACDKHWKEWEEYQCRLNG